MKTGSSTLDLDSADIRRARAGDTQAFSHVVHRHARQSYQIARAILDNHADADDAVQEAWLRVWRSLDQFDLSMKFAPWLARIVANTARDLYRRRNVRAADVIPDDLLGAADESEERIALRHGLTSALSQLSPRRKEIVLLHDVYGVAHQEIANLLDMRIGTVRAELSYARRELRAALVDWRSVGGNVAYPGEHQTHG